VLDKDLRRKLTKLRSDGRAAPAPAGAAEADPPTGAGPAAIDPADADVSPFYFPVDPDDTSFVGLLGGEEREAESGPYWLTTMRADHRWAAARDLYDRLAPGDAGPPDDVPELGTLEQSDLLFVDIETTGLSGVPLFLIGALDFAGGTPNLSFYLARDYAEELSMLEAFADFIQSFRAVVTFNGKSFDIPYIADRARYWRLPFATPGRHIDVPHAARRRWQGDFGDCKLQTLELNLCGRQREGDVPGHLIPEVYHEFVATGNAGLLVPILQHNALDLLTLAELLGIALTVAPRARARSPRPPRRR
jgi:uncharacterized protein YprB with RNaseH-like and TPR domain